MRFAVRRGFSTTVADGVYESLGRHLHERVVILVVFASGKLQQRRRASLMVDDQAGVNAFRDR